MLTQYTAFSEGGELAADFFSTIFLAEGIGELAIKGLGRLALGSFAKGVSVIGPRATYRQFAKDIGANFLNVTDDAWTWDKNLKFLQRVVKRGDDVIFAGEFNPNLLDKTSVLAKEINYLESHGYQWTSDFTKMILKK